MTTVRVIARTLAVLLLLVLAVPPAWAVVSGDFYMTVEGRSMTPTYQVGDVLVVQEPTGRELQQVGEIVIMTFDPAADESRFYVHRVVEPLEDGTAWLQGDGNPDRDPRPVSQDAVRGTPRVVVPGAAAEAFRFSQSGAGRLVLGGLALLLLLLPLRTRTTPEPDADRVPE